MFRPSPEQQALIESSGNIFVEACPGAGKTTTIVERYYRLTNSQDRKGIALVSFSRAAVDEVEVRCGSFPSALKAPNFVGTLDSFINRFIVKPIFTLEQCVVPDFVDTWSDAYVRPIKPPFQRNPSGRGNNQWAAFSMDWFDFDESGNATLSAKKVSGQQRDALISVGEANQQAIAASAKDKRQQLLNAGLLSSAESRRQLHKILGTTRGKQILDVLAARFKEIIVDEAQDCSVEDLSLLKELRERGISVVMVADLDQAIYEFRDAVPALVREFVSEQCLETGNRIKENFRSTPTICKLVDCLRSSNGTDEPKNNDRIREDNPVVVVPYDDISEVSDKLSCLDIQSIPAAQIMVLAHATNDAKQGAGMKSHTANTSTHKVIQIASASRTVRDNGYNKKARQQAIAQVERLILGCIQEIDLSGKSTDSICEDFKINRRWLRSAAFFTALGTKDPSQLNKDSYTQEVQSVLKKITWPADLSVSSFTQHFTRPTANQWSKLNFSGTDSALPRYEYSTIHGVKGKEFKAVALVIPQKLKKDENGLTALDYWERNIDHESRRVLYVGASRAQIGLILVLHTSHVERIKALLTNNSIDFIEG